jgi:hypothetical protein
MVVVAKVSNWKFFVSNPLLIFNLFSFAERFFFFGKGVSDSVLIWQLFLFCQILGLKIVGMQKETMEYC